MFEAHFADLDVAASILPREADHRADGILRILPPPGERLVDEPIGKRCAGSLIGELVTGGMLKGREIAREAGEGGSEIWRTEEQKAQFLIKDNVGFGEWNWEELANEWDVEQLEDWGLNIPQFSTDVDYSILDDDDVSQQLEDMTDGVKKAIQIEFEAEHYETAYELVKFWRDQNAYVGGMVMEYLKAEKEKL
jgi:hypothetical protein